MKFFSQSVKRVRQNIISVGRLEKQKNWFLLIEAFSLIANKITDNLEIYGEGSILQKLKDYCIELKVSDRISFYGHSNEIHNKLASMRLFVLTSDYEGMPNALLEAQAVGLPCITTDFDGGSAQEIIKNRVNGIVVPKGNPVILSNVIMELIQDIELSNKLCYNAKKAALRYESNKVCEDWNTAFQKVVISNNRINHDLGNN